MNTYTAVATKAGKYWQVEVAGLELVTQARHLGELEDMARDLISIHTDQAPESFTLETRVVLPDDAQKARKQAEEMRAKAAQYNGEAAAYSRQSVALMRKQGFTQKDIAAALGISRQRAAQLASEAGQTQQAA